MRFIKPSRLALGVTALVLGALTGAGAAYAAPGDLDLSFSGDGKLTIDLGGPERGESVALRPNPSTPSSIAIAGSTIADAAGESDDFAFALISSTGSVATSSPNFSGDSDESAFGIAVQPNDQRVVMVGHTDAGSDGFAVARLDGNLALDPGFNTVGWLAASRRLVRPRRGDRRTTTTSWRWVSPGRTTSATLRSPASPPPDPPIRSSRWTGTAKRRLDFSNGADQAHAVAIQPGDQKIVVAGLGGPPGESDFALARYTKAGALDTSFSAPDGKLTTDFGGVSFADDVATPARRQDPGRGHGQLPHRRLCSRALQHRRLARHQFLV